MMRTQRLCRLVSLAVCLLGQSIPRLEAFSVRRKHWQAFRHSGRRAQLAHSWTTWKGPLEAVSSSSSSSEDEDCAELITSLEQQPQNQTSSALTTTTAIANASTALALQQQAAALRAEVELIEANLRASQEAKRKKEIEDIDRWIEECLYVSVAGAGSAAAAVELLNSVDKAAQVLRDNRFSHEQVSKMFERICDTSPAQSRSNCSPLLALLVDAAGKLDCVERQDNPNKRWDGKVERDLRQRLFAMDWGIDLEDTQKRDDRFL